MGSPESKKRMLIQFDLNNPAHAFALKIVKSKGHHKSDYIVRAINFYENNSIESMGIEGIYRGENFKKALAAILTEASIDVSKSTSDASVAESKSVPEESVEPEDNEVSDLLSDGLNAFK